MSLNAKTFEFLLSQVRASGVALAGGKVYFYAAGTSTPKTVWLDRGKTTPAANPYTLDSNGTAHIFGDGLYRVVIQDSNEVEKYDRDNISIRDISGSVYDVADYASLNAAVVAIGSTPATLQYSSDVTVTANLVIPATLELMPLNGAKVNHGAYTISYAGSTARWPVAQIFNGTGAISGIHTGKPEWLGAKADNSTNSTSPLNRAGSYFQEILLSGGIYLTSGWAVTGHAKQFKGVSAVETGRSGAGTATAIKAIGSQTFTMSVTGAYHKFENITFNGADATTAVVDMLIANVSVRFHQCVFEHTLPVTGILVRIDSTNGGASASIQGDSNVFEDCVFWQDHTSTTKCGEGLSIIGSNAFLVHVHRSKFWYCSTGVKISLGAGAWIDDVQFDSWTVAAVYIQGNFQQTIVEKCYTESSPGVNFLTMVDQVALSTSALTIRNNILNSTNNLSLIPLQPIILEGNNMQGLVFINDPGVANYPFVVSIGNAWEGSGSFTGAKFDSVIRIGDTASAGTVSYNFGLGSAFTGLSKIFSSNDLVWNPGTIANGAGATSSDITATGAAFGDVVVVSAPYDLQGVTVTGYVKSANVIVIRIQNGTGGNVTLASGTWTTKVIKP